jgi:ABC-type branched-subunit amino acid transport system substrate-binding protein
MGANMERRGVGSAKRATAIRASFLVLFSVGPARAAPARADDVIRVGMSAALSGPAQALGLGMKAGIEAYFRSVNRAGGVQGRRLELIARDDAYEPGRTGPIVRELIDVEQVFAILGNPGTPTAAVTVPIANSQHVPFVAPFTGAGLLRRTPPDRYVFNLRASYAQETAEMVRGLITEAGIRPDEIVFFTQNDAYGDAGYAGAVAALRAAGYRQAAELPHGRYQRNTLDVEGALARLLDPSLHPRAVIMIGAYAPCAKFISLARREGMHALFVNVSFVLGDMLNRELGAAGEGVVVTQVVPPLDAPLPVLKEYQAEVPAGEASFVSLEGFLAAKVFVQGLLRAGPGATREQFIDALEAGSPLELGIGPLTPLSKARHQISDRVWPTVLHGGRFHAITSWSELRGRAGRGR